MRKEKTLTIEVFENGLPLTSEIPFVKTTNDSIMSFLESRKETDNTIIGIYNEQENILDVLKGDDEYGVIAGFTQFIHEYPGDIADTHLYASVRSNYAHTLLSLINYEHRFMKKYLKRDKSLGLIKKSRYNY